MTCFFAFVVNIFLYIFMYGFSWPLVHYSCSRLIAVSGVPA